MIPVTQPQPALKVYDGMHKQVAISDIKYLVGSTNYCFIHLVNQPPILIPYHLKEMQRRLPDFVRIHKGYLINPLFLPTNLRLRYQTKAVLLTTGDALPIARRRVTELAVRFNSNRPQ